MVFNDAKEQEAVSRLQELIGSEKGFDEIVYQSGVILSDFCDSIGYNELAKWHKIVTFSEVTG